MMIIINDIFSEKEMKVVAESKLLIEFAKTQKMNTTIQVLEAKYGISKCHVKSILISRLNTHRDGNDYILLKSELNLQKIETFIGN